MADKKNEIEKDFVQLARIALAGRGQDVQALLQRLIRRYRDGAPQLAEALTSLVQESPTRASPLRRQAEVPLPVDLESRLHLLRVEEEPFLDQDPVFAPIVGEKLGQLVDERHQPDVLLRLGLEPTRTALFTGAPGVGKTLAARWIARQLKRPLLILDLAAVMSSFLGRTGNNVRQVLDYAKGMECVLLLDELDAIAKRRDDQGEIGELKRLVTVLIQQIDDWPASGLLLAATNHPDLLDPAIWRRFEAVVEFPLPDQSTISRFVRSSLEPYIERADLWARGLSLALHGRSFSDIDRDLARARRAAALRGAPLEDALADLFRADHLPRDERVKLASHLVAENIVSQRKAQELTGIARDTIRTYIKTHKPEKHGKGEAA
jgi:SpoVK/Ycf46/Vps4 family AAA+-type ATPase